MALAQKTVMYTIPMVTTDSTDAVSRTLGTVTVDIPETTSRTFKSVFAEWSYMDGVTATGGTVSESRLGIQIDAVAVNTITELDDLTHSGENISGVLQIDDHTSYFQTNFTGTSHTITVTSYVDMSTGTTLVSRNECVILYITYEYDDTSATQVKTVIIPFESTSAALSTTADTQIGTNQIPQLTGTGGFLAENTVTIKDWFIIAEGNVGNGAGAVDITLSFRVDNDTTYNPGIIERALASDGWYRFIYKPTVVPNTTVNHIWKAWSSVATTFHSMAFKLVVTYTFNASASTRITNSIALPIVFNGMKPNATERQALIAERNLNLPEPGTLEFLQSGCQVNYSTANAATVLIKVGDQTAFKTFNTNQTLSCGMATGITRTDAGAFAGSMFTIGRGFFKILFKLYASAGTIGTASGILYLNYISDKSSLGTGAHQCTKYQLIRSLDRTASSDAVSSVFQPTKPSKWYLTGLGFIAKYWDVAALNANTLQLEKSSGTVSRENLGTNFNITDAELGYFENIYSARDYFKRHDNDPDTDRVDFFASNNGYRLSSLSTIQFALIAMWTSHSCYTSESAAVTNYSGDGSGITINVRRQDTGEIVSTTVTSAGGTFTFDNYWQNIPIFTEAYQSSLLFGRSDTKSA